MPIELIIFYILATTLLFAATMVVFTRNPVPAAMFLVLTFVASAGLWLLLEAEFLALVLVLVYVGAVTTLFLFVVMMIDLNKIPALREGYVKYLPLGLLVIAITVGTMIYVLKPQHFGIHSFPLPVHQRANYSNVKELGSVLYTYYAYPFILASVLLLAGIVAAISITLRGKQNRKGQVVSQQVAVNRDDRVRLVKMKAVVNNKSED